VRHNRSVTAPTDLRAALDRLQSGERTAGLSREVDRLIGIYRGAIPTDKPALRNHADVLAYASYRMPATNAAVGSALAQFGLLAPGWVPDTQVDIGGGTGAAAWAAAEIWPALRRITVLDWADAALDLGRTLAQSSEQPALLRARWERQAIGADLVLPDADLVTVAYVLGELTEPDQAAIVAESAAHGQVVAVVEPGTPAGYRRILSARDGLISAGMSIVAPCPHSATCPISETADDWCHFATRVNRSSLHRTLKGGALAYEDEKYSYVIASRTPFPPAAGRVLRHPFLRKGMVNFSLCTADNGLEQLIVTKSQGQAYRTARNTDWGEAWPKPLPGSDGDSLTRGDQL
jgi:ribosomal protein RSM22 (predicted rRNA methylase)